MKTLVEVERNDGVTISIMTDKIVCIAKNGKGKAISVLFGDAWEYISHAIHCERCL